SRDWSSDVCSSDLPFLGEAREPPVEGTPRAPRSGAPARVQEQRVGGYVRDPVQARLVPYPDGLDHPVSVPPQPLQKGVGLGTVELQRVEAGLRGGPADGVVVRVDKDAHAQ